MRFLAVSLLLSFSSAWGSEIIKSCTVTLNSMETGAPITQTIDIVRTEQGVFAGDEAVVIQENPVRPGLRALIEASQQDEAPADFNMAERHVAFPMLVAKMMRNDPEMTPEVMAQMMPYYDTGIDLDLVRSAKTYALGEATNMGQVVLVEAKDEAGNVLGSFMGGFFAVGCK